MASYVQSKLLYFLSLVPYYFTVRKSTVRWKTKKDRFRHSPPSQLDEFLVLAEHPDRHLERVPPEGICQLLGNHYLQHPGEAVLLSQKITEGRANL